TRGSAAAGSPSAARGGDLITRGAAGAESPSAARGGDLTTRGAAGTPAYMSAEQWAGGAVDARSDQFAFCVVLWEALFGERPFHGASLPALRTAVCAGATAPPPAGRGVPRWLVAVIRRGLAVDPAVRWPDLAALLDALARGAAVRRRWAVAAIAVAVAAVSAVTTAWLVARPAPADPCAPPAARLAAAWGPVQRAAVRVRFAGADPALGADRFTRTAAVLDDRSARWAAMHVETCRATRDGRQSDAVLDLRMACLDRWLGELGETSRVFAQAGDRTAVDHAVTAALALSPLDACGDARALSATLPPPAGAAARARVAELTRRAQTLEVARRAGLVAGLPARGRALVGDARALGHAPALAEALAVEARIEHAVGDQTALEATLRELIQVAARARDDRDQAFAWTSLIKTVGYDQHKPDEALALVPAASAAIVRAGDPVDLQVGLLLARATVIDVGPHVADGLALLAEARRLLDQAGARAPMSPLADKLADVLFETGSARAYSDDLDGAVATFQEAIEIWRALYGPDSPDEAFGWYNTGGALQSGDQVDRALVAYGNAARIREARLGDSPMLAMTLSAVASATKQQGQLAPAVAIYDRALRMYRAHVGPDDLQLADPLLGRANALSGLGRLDDAARDYDAAIALYDRAGVRSELLALTLYNRGELQQDRRRDADALRDDTRSIALFEAVRGPRASGMIFPLVGAARCLIRLGRPAEAIPLLQRALELPVGDVPARRIALARYSLGRALAETGRDVAGGLAMVRAARAGLAADKRAADYLHELDRWLAQRH
ncbi:MAG TPA: tetratricopeptide repeat protein, partial [Kofleriaceae bacterium]